MTIHFFVGYSREFGVISRHSPVVDNFLNSHYLSSLQSIKIVKRIYILITPGSERVKTVEVFTQKKNKYSKDKTVHGWAQLEKIKMECIGVNMRNAGPVIFEFISNGRKCH